MGEQGPTRDPTFSKGIIFYWSSEWILCGSWYVLEMFSLEKVERTGLNGQGRCRGNDFSRSFKNVSLAQFSHWDFWRDSPGAVRGSPGIFLYFGVAGSTRVWGWRVVSWRLINCWEFWLCFQWFYGSMVPDRLNVWFWINFLKIGGRFSYFHRGENTKMYEMSDCH